SRLAAMRILLALSLLTDQLFPYLPNLTEFFGPTGTCPADLYARNQLYLWKVTPAFFATDNPSVFYTAFGIWVASTVLLLVGWKTRWSNAAVWLLTRCFLDRTSGLNTCADDLVQVA